MREAADDVGRLVALVYKLVTSSCVLPRPTRTYAISVLSARQESPAGGYPAELPWRRFDHNPRGDRSIVKVPMPCRFAG